MARTYAYMPLLIKLIVVLFNLIFLYELLQMDYLSGEDFSSNVSTNIFIILISFTLCFILLLPLIIPIGIKKGKIPKVIKIKYQNPFYGIMINKKFIQGNTIESVDFQKNYKSNRIFLMIETSCKTQKYYLGNLNQNNNKCFCYNHLEQLESSLIKLVGLDKFLGDEM
ncbi:MAG: hypothetical protein GX896_09900 [Clostridiales bacterium]|nr:hypothetical protein [Clostridiales bacterium]